LLKKFYYLDSHFSQINILHELTVLITLILKEKIQEARDQVDVQYHRFAVLAALIGFHVVTVLLLGYQLTGS